MNTFQGESINNKIKLPKVNINKKNNNSSSQNILKQRNKFNKIINNIKNDFEELDSNNNKLLKNNIFRRS